ncbi:MAG: hypothetical protein ACT4O2_01835, partial [Beijerinckiaceae bacterium]
MAIQEASFQKNREAKPFKLDIAVHRRILNYLNEAIQPEELVYEKVSPPNPEVDPIHEDYPEERKLKRKKILDFEVAKALIEFRDQEYPLGFRNLKEVTVFDRRLLDVLLHYFGHTFFGSWSVFPQP